jgi:hypothetical protein
MSPFVKVRSRVGLPSLSQEMIALHAGGKPLGLGADRGRESPQPVLKRFGWFETLPLGHRALLSVQRKAGAQWAISSQIEATIRTVIVGS